VKLRGGRICETGRF